ncbi:Phospho-N-acetylmuramoyl-pentapeptide-transferase, partial [Bienertia sinuspersici]
EDANNKVKKCLASSSSNQGLTLRMRFLMILCIMASKVTFWGARLITEGGYSYVIHSAVKLENLKVVFSVVKKKNEALQQKNQALESNFDDTT